MRSENVAKKASYNKFCEKLRTYTMKEFRGGEYVIDVTKDPNDDTLKSFATPKKPIDPTAAEENSDIEVEIKKEEVKEYVKQLTRIKSNLKKMYVLVFGNSTDGVQTMLKVDKVFEAKSKKFNCSWILLKTITSGLDTKVNLRVSLHTAIMNVMLLRQFGDESNKAYLTRFKYMVKTLTLAGGDHVLASPTIL